MQSWFDRFRNRLQEEEDQIELRTHSSPVDLKSFNYRRKNSNERIKYVLRQSMSMKTSSQGDQVDVVEYYASVEGKKFCSFRFFLKKFM